MKSRSSRTSALEKYANDLAACEPLDGPEERQMARAFAAGDGLAGERIVLAHLRYVADAARGFVGCGIAFEDLVQEGNLGLLKALSRFEAERPSSRVGGGAARFIAYAAPWVRAYMIRAIQDGATTVRVGRHIRLALAKVRKLDAVTMAVCGRPADDTETAAYLSVSHEKVRFLRITESVRFCSFDQPLPASDDVTVTLHERIASNDLMLDDAISDKAVAEKRAAALRKAAGSFGGRERKIFLERIMRDDEDRKTHAQLGREMGLSRTRVQQLETRVMRMLRTLIVENDDTRKGPKDHAH